MMGSQVRVLQAAPDPQRLDDLARMRMPELAAFAEMTGAENINLPYLRRFCT